MNRSAALAVTAGAEGSDVAVGLPLLATLTLPELRAALAHEYGRLDDAAAADPGWGADEIAARVAGPEAAAAALRRVVCTEVAVARLRERFVPLLPAGGPRPSVVDGLRRLMEADAHGLGAAVDSALAGHARGYWPASYPEVKDRIVRFEIQARAAVLLRDGGPGAPSDPPTPASDLVGGADGLARLERAVEGHPEPMAPWEDLLEQATVAQARTEAAALVAAARSTTGRARGGPRGPARRPRRRDGGRPGGSAAGRPCPWPAASGGGGPGTRLGPHRARDDRAPRARARPAEARLDQGGRARRSVGRHPARRGRGSWRGSRPEPGGRAPELAGRARPRRRLAAARARAAGSGRGRPRRDPGRRGSGARPGDGAGGHGSRSRGTCPRTGHAAP